MRLLEATNVEEERDALADMIIRIYTAGRYIISPPRMPPMFRCGTESTTELGYTEPATHTRQLYSYTDTENITLQLSVHGIAQTLPTNTFKPGFMWVMMIIIVDGYDLFFYVLQGCLNGTAAVHSPLWRHGMETFPRYWPFVRGIHRSRWIPRTKASDAELWCFLWSAPE